MAGSENAAGTWLRPALTAAEHARRSAAGEIFERGGRVVQPNRRLSQLVHRRPAGVTAHQWNTALRTLLHFVVCDSGSYLPEFAVEFVDPAQPAAEAERGDRMLRAVCEAVGLPLLRIESSVLRTDSYGRRIVEYVMDAQAFLAVTRAPLDPGAGEAHTDAPLSYRDIIGRLPDGRSGFVNDLGAVARSVAMNAYVDRTLADPIIRGLHVRWTDGPAEGWAWVEVRDGRYLFERTRIWQYQFSCGVDAGQLAEDLAVAGIGERLKALAVDEPVLREGRKLAGDLDQLRLRRAEMDDDFGYEHISFG